MKFLKSGYNIFKYPKVDRKDRNFTCNIDLVIDPILFSSVV